MPHMLPIESPASVNVAVAELPAFPITKIGFGVTVGSLRMSPVQSALFRMVVKV